MFKQVVRSKTLQGRLEKGEALINGRLLRGRMFLRASREMQKKDNQCESTATESHRDLQRNSILNVPHGWMTHFHVLSGWTVSETSAPNTLAWKMELSLNSAALWPRLRVVRIERHLPALPAQAWIGRFLECS